MDGTDIWDLADDDRAEAWANCAAELGGYPTRIRYARARLASAGIGASRALMELMHCSSNLWGPDGTTQTLREPLELIPEDMARSIRQWLDIAPRLEEHIRAPGTSAHNRAGDSGSDRGHRTGAVHDTCAIFFEEVEDHGGIRWPGGGCNHWYHAQCYAALLGHRGTDLRCPQCRCPGAVWVQRD